MVYLVRIIQQSSQTIQGHCLSSSNALYMSCINGRCACEQADLRVLGGTARCAGGDVTSIAFLIFLNSEIKMMIPVRIMLSRRKSMSTGATTTEHILELACWLKRIIKYHEYIDMIRHIYIYIL